MPVPSAFTPCGFLACSSAPSHAEEIYNEIIRLYGSSSGQTFDFSPGTHAEARAYMFAMALAGALYELEHAGNQAKATRCYDLLPLQELDYQLTPGPFDTVPQRQAALAARKLAATGDTAANLVAGLKAILGPAFLSSSSVGDVTVASSYPNSPGSGPGTFTDARVPPRVVKLVDPVHVTGVPIWCAYQALDPSSTTSVTWQSSASFGAGLRVVPTVPNATGYFYQATAVSGPTGTSEPSWPTHVGATVTDNGITWACAGAIAPQLHAGDVVTVQGENSGAAEQVTILAVANTKPIATASAGYLYLRATFTKPHDVGASVFAGNFPYWWSTRRHMFVIANASAQTRETRRKVDEFMARIARTVDTWALVQPASTTGSGGVIGPLTVGSPIGAVPIGSFNYTNSS